MKNVAIIHAFIEFQSQYFSGFKTFKLIFQIRDVPSKTASHVSVFSFMPPHFRRYLLYGICFDTNCQSQTTVKEVCQMTAN